jgi:hypothetical protein
MLQSTKINTELHRWFYGSRHNKIHLDINKRGIMESTHLLCMGTEPSRVVKLRTKNDIGELNHLKRNLSKIKNL